ncbi:flagellar hook-length control protein FliK [Belnapia sp. T18]|uniref:Flagellar hook-length control protein FliK n=1 Tax=Belnapia arida TaxID=2804533 RepID=A0ABS1TWM8_9PROT|nr:flagellar hook-length control protein FliK [Belnapia arida]MBL6076620.1 flagellar hook-length control protein FliK [Belnapia arida]
MDLTALPPSPTATPAPPADAAGKPPAPGSGDFAALLLRAGQDVAEPIMPAALAPAGLPPVVVPVVTPSLAPPAAPGLPDAAQSGTAAGTNPEKWEESGDAEDARVPDLAYMPPALIAGAMPLPVPPPVPAMTGPTASASLPGASAATAGVTAMASAGRPVIATGTMREAPPPAAPDGDHPGQLEAAERFSGGMPGAPQPEPGALSRPVPQSGPAPGPRLAAAQPAAAPFAGVAAQANPALPADSQPAQPPLLQPLQAASPDRAKPSPPRDRPMAVAAAIGQAAAQEQVPAAPDQPAPQPERIGLEPAAILATPHRVVEPARTQPAPPDPLQAVPSGLNPASTAFASADGTASVASAGTAPAAPPPPPAHQVAQVTIALALGQDRAPRLTVALEPESLGRVEIRIERGADGEAASVRVLAERPETLALLQRDARELDRTLAQAGVVVASGGMQFGLSSGQGGAPQEQRPQQQGGGQGHGQGATKGGGHASLAAAGPVQTTLNTLSLLDIAV